MNISRLLSRGISALALLLALFTCSGKSAFASCKQILQISQKDTGPDEFQRLLDLADKVMRKRNAC